LTSLLRFKEGLQNTVADVLGCPVCDSKLRTMKQADLGLNLTIKCTRRREFLDEMNRVAQWAAMVELVAAHAPEGKRGRPPFPVEKMLRIQFMQQSFALSDPTMEESLHDVPLFHEFAGLDNWKTRLPNGSTILRFRHLLEKHKLAPQILATVNDLLRSKGLQLKVGTVVNAALISAPSSIKNATGERDPEMHQSKKGNQWYFGMKALTVKSQQILAGIRAQVEYPSRVTKRQFGFTKVRYRGLKKNAAHVQTLFALSNL